MARACGAFLLTLPFIQDPSALLTALSTYAQHWSFNGSVFAVLFPVLGIWTRPILAGAGLLILGVGLQLTELCRLALWVCGSILLSPTVHPWYVLWAWVPALLLPIGHGQRWRPGTSYVALLTLDENTGQWAPPLGLTGHWYLWRCCCGCSSISSGENSRVRFD